LWFAITPEAVEAFKAGWEKAAAEKIVPMSVAVAA
jgi:hypothetical protein